MNPECIHPRKGQDCITRNAATLCDGCYPLLTEDEHKARDIHQLVTKFQKTAAGAKRGCTKRRVDRVWRQNPRRYRDVVKTCIQREIYLPCAGCLAGMSAARLHRYATKLYERDAASRQYWDDLEEAKEYSRELRSKGVIGIEWNIEDGHSDEDGGGRYWTDEDSLACAKIDSKRVYPERRILINGLFEVSKPCFIHGVEGLLPLAVIQHAA